MNRDDPLDSRQLLEAVQAAQRCVLDPARPDAVARQRGDGKLTARERIALVADPDSFVEYGALVAPLQEAERMRDVAAPADGVVTGICRLDGRSAVLTSQDFTVLGGSSSKVGAQKVTRSVELAIDRGIPLVRLLEGGGHRIQDGLDARHFAPGHRMFHAFARASGWVPVAAGMLGPCFAGPTNHAAFADFVVMVRGIATMGMAGPSLVRAGTGEEIGKEELGGIEMQVSQNGIADLAVDTEQECMLAIRRFLSYLPPNAREPLPIEACDDPPGRREEALLDLVPANTRKAYDMRKVITLVADRGSVFELKPTHAANVVTSMARLDGRPVGIIANNPMKLAGMLDANACEKAAHFVALCDAFGLPLIYLVDVPGFAIGSAAEESRMARRSAKLLQELGHATVPRISVVLRKGYGLAYVAMCGGRSFDADAVLAWPTAEICAMSVEGAVDIAYRSEVAADPQARARLVSEFKRQLGALRAAEHFGVDDVIDPRDTRRRLIETLATCPARRRIEMPPKFRAISPL